MLLPEPRYCARLVASMQLLENGGAGGMGVNVLCHSSACHYDFWGYMQRKWAAHGSGNCRRHPMDTQFLLLTAALTCSLTIAPLLQTGWW